MTRQPRMALLAAFACMLGAVAVWAVAFRTDAGRWLDGAVLQGFTGLRGELTTPLAGALARMADPLPFALLTGTVACLALARGRRRVAALCLVAPVAAAVTTQLLKPALAAPREHEFLGLGQIADAAWPSGHTTAAMSLALAAVIAAPPVLRGIAAVLGAAFALCVVYAILVLGWHFPSDVLGGFLVSGTWTFLGVAAVLASERRFPAGRTARWDALRVVATGAVGIGMVGAAALLIRLDDFVDYARGHTAFVVGAATIAVAAVVLAGAFAVLFTDGAPGPRAARRPSWHRGKG